MGRVELKLASPASQILVISGWRGVGKTTLCQRLVDVARAAGWDVAGLLSTPRFVAGQKTGIEVEDLRSGWRRLLASLLENELQEGVRLGPWMFDEDLFAWGNRVLLSAIPCDLLVIDEIGPLEFDKNQGWTESFRILDRRSFRLAFVVIRPEYIDRFMERWPDAERTVLANPNEVNPLSKRLKSRFS
jgi:nucleoside-triphosphatase THEP1